MACFRVYSTIGRGTWLLVLITLALATAACGGGRQPSLEERAQSIDKSLICPVCPGETIDQAQVQLAHQMRDVVRENLAEGWSRERILDFFVDRYGEGVLAAPPKSGFNLVAWLVPPVGVVGAFLLLLVVIRSMRRGGDVGSEEVADPELEPYLSLVDRELGISQEGSQRQDVRE